MARRSISGARALVTGASSGIGRELALQLVARGARVLAAARRRERLASLAEAARPLTGQLDWLAGDVADPAFRTELVDDAARRFGSLDLLVNNAGVGATGPFCEAAPERLRRIMEVNFFAPAELIRQALPLLRAGRQPLIVNVSSVLGRRAMPYKSEYCASKFALEGLSQALRGELAPDGVAVLVVCPSTTQTEFFDRLLERRTEPARSPFGAMSAERVARQTIAAIQSGRRERVLSLSGRAFVALARFAPRLADWAAARAAAGSGGTAAELGGGPSGRPPE